MINKQIGVKTEAKTGAGGEKLYTGFKINFGI